MRTPLSVLLIVAVAVPAGAQQRSVRAGADNNGPVVAASTFVGRPADRGGFQLEMALHGDQWFQAPVILHGDYYKSRGKMLYLAIGPAAIVNLRRDEGERRVSLALSAGGGYEQGRFIIDARYTSGMNVVSVTAGVRFR